MTMEQTKLAEVLRLHKLWLEAKPEGVRADLSGADLSGAYLSGATLYGANLSGANLHEANLSRTDLSGADLSGANLPMANLYKANLSKANLSGATFVIAGQRLKVEKNFTRVVGSMHDGYRIGDFLKIGCQEYSISYWLEHVRELAVQAKYTPKQVDEYEDIVAFVALRAGYPK